MIAKTSLARVGAQSVNLFPTLYPGPTLMATELAATLRGVTTREKFDRLVDQLSGPSLKAEYARLLREREIDRQLVESYERTPQFAPDGWGDQEATNRSSRRELLERLDREEHAAGLDSW